MTMRFVRTIDEAPHMFASGADADENWLLYRGAWLAGRVTHPGGWHSGQAMRPAQRRARSSAGPLTGVELALTGHGRTRPDLVGTIQEDVNAPLMAPAARIRRAGFATRADHDDRGGEGRDEQECHPGWSVSS